MLGPVQVKSMVEQYTHYALKSILGLKSQFATKGKSSLADIIHKPMYEAATCAFFGPSFPAAATYPVLQIFDKGVPMMAAGMPEIFIPETIRARDELYRLFGEYLAAPHEPCEMMQRVDNLGKDAGWTPFVLMQMFFGMLWPLVCRIVAVSL